MSAWILLLVWFNWKRCLMSPGDRLLMSWCVVLMSFFAVQYCCKWVTLALAVWHFSLSHLCTVLYLFITFSLSHSSFLVRDILTISLILKFCGYVLYGKSGEIHNILVVKYRTVTVNYMICCTGLLLMNLVIF